MKVADLMTKHVEFVEPDTTVQEAAALMGELDVSALPVGSAEALQGIITDRDILYRVVAEGRDPRRTAVHQAATRDVFTCRPDDTVKVAMGLMAAQNVRRLPVMNEEQHVIGWITLSDLSRQLLVGNETMQNVLREITDSSAGEPPA